MQSHLHALFVVTTILLLVSESNQAKGQIQLLGEHLLNPRSAELDSIGQKPLIYAPVKTDSDILYFTPFFVFENTTDGKLKVDLSKPLRDGDPWKVRLTLLVSPNWLLDAIAGEIRNWAKTQVNPRYNRYKAINATSLIPAELTYIYVQELSSAPSFTTIVNNNIITQQPLYLEAQKDTKEQALALQKNLENRESSALFNVNYRLFARVTVSESRAEVSRVSITQTEGNKTLSGAGRAFKFSVSPSEGVGTIGADQRIITRDQKDAFEARVRNEIAGDYIIENEDDRKFIDQKLDDFFKIALREEAVAFEHIGKAMTLLSEYNFRPADLSPEKIQQLAVEAKNALHTEDQSRFSFSGSGSASYLGFGGSASASYTRDNLKKHMEDKGWTFGITTEVYVPKTFTVYVIDKTQLNSDTFVSTKISRRFRDTPDFDATVTTAKGFCDKSVEFGAKALTGVNMSETITNLYSLVSDLERNKLKYKRIEFVLAPARDPKDPNVLQAPIHTAVNHTIPVPDSKELIATWTTPIDAIHNQDSWFRIDPRISGKSVVISLLAKTQGPSSTGTNIRVVVHVIYK
jgi:hypothetical protein